MAKGIDIAAIRKLSVAERMAIAELIWDTIAEEDLEFTVSVAAKKEMDRRAKELRDNPEAGVGLEEARKWLRSKQWQ